MQSLQTELQEPDDAAARPHKPKATLPADHRKGRRERAGI